MSKAVSKTFMLLGQCLPSLKQNASKIRVRRMKLDTNLNMVRKISRFPGFSLTLQLFHSTSEKTRFIG